MPQLPATLRYSALVALTGVAVVVLIGFFWWSAWDSSGQRIEAAHQRIARVAWIIAHRDDLMRGAGKSTNHEDLASTFLAATSEEQAGTQLQQRLKQLIDASGASIVTAQPLAVRQEAGLAIPSVRYQVTASIAAAKQLLYLIENGRPFMFIDAADISAQGLGNMATAGASLPMITLQLEVHAYAKVPSNGS